MVVTQSCRKSSVSVNKGHKSRNRCIYICILVIKSLTLHKVWKLFSVNANFINWRLLCACPTKKKVWSFLWNHLILICYLYRSVQVISQNNVLCEYMWKINSTVQVSFDIMCFCNPIKNHYQLMKNTCNILNSILHIL